MAYVTPSSILYLLKNVPLDVEHKHTWYFGPTEYEAQLAKFLSYFERDAEHPENELVIYDSQYIRYEEGSIKVPFPIAKCIACNYMVFGNPHFEGRWFYAFITNVEYVSNDCTRIYYEIDEVQTWICFATFQQCFIVRQHQLTDSAGDNLVPEGLETGDYVVDWQALPSQFTQNSIVVASTLNHTGAYIPGSVVNGIYTGAAYTVFSPTQGIAEINTFLADLQGTGHTDAIVSLFMCPTCLFNDPPQFYVNLSKPTTLNGYTPRNKKLLTYPYMFCYVSNMQGVAAVYHWEYFYSTPQFYVNGAIGCSPEFITWPKYYKGQADAVDESMRVSGWPQCSFANDAYKAYVAQQSPIVSAGMQLVSEMGVSSAGGGVNAEAGSGLSGFLAKARAEKDFIMANWKTSGPAPLTGIEPKQPTNDDETIFSLIRQFVQHFIKPPQTVGSTSANALFTTNQLGFLFAYKSITAQFAQIIDQYFDRFGYAIHRNQTPNLHARKGWTYIQTKNCVVNGAMPAASARFIEDCMNAGITFWNPNYTMGDYTQDNTPGGV